MDPHAQARRRLWSAVLLAVLDDFNRDFVKRGDAALDRAAAYLESRNGRCVAALAGIDLRLDAAIRLIALPRPEFRARPQSNTKPENSHE